MTRLLAFLFIKCHLTLQDKIYIFIKEPCKYHAKLRAVSHAENGLLMLTQNLIGSQILSKKITKRVENFKLFFLANFFCFIFWNYTITLILRMYKWKFVLNFQPARIFWLNGRRPLETVFFLLNAMQCFPLWTKFPSKKIKKKPIEILKYFGIAVFNFVTHKI